MNKKIIVTLISALVVLLLAVAIIEIVGHKKDNNTGYDEVDVGGDTVTGEIYDLETGEVIDVITDDKDNNPSSNSTDKTSSQTSEDNQTGVETVGEAGIDPDRPSDSTTGNSNEISGSTGSSDSTNGSSDSSNPKEDPNYGWGLWH